MADDLIAKAWRNLFATQPDSAKIAAAAQRELFVREQHKHLELAEDLRRQIEWMDKNLAQFQQNAKAG